MIPLLAQLIAPPLQNSPVRLPGPEAGEQRPAPEQRPPALEIEPQPGSGGETPRAPAPFGSPGAQMPRIQGLTRYSASQLQAILAPCRVIVDPTARINACAAALTARLVADGYLNSRVYGTALPAPGLLEVVEGRIVELRVLGPDAWLNRRVSRLLAPLRGSVLQVARVEGDLQLLRRQAGVAEVRGNLSRLGGDPSQAVFTVSIRPGPQPWQGEISARNDGSNGSGEFRGVAALSRSGLIRRGDVLLLYGESDASNRSELGALISSASYTLPLADTLSVTGAFGYSRRNLVELPAPADGFSTSQYQGFGQLEWVFSETLRQRWSLFAAYSGNRSNTYFKDRSLPDDIPEVVSSPSSGYLRLGLGNSGSAERLGWSGSTYLLQGVAAATPENQRRDLAVVGIDPGRATALGGIVSLGWALAPRWQINLRAAGQLALEPLTSPMQFNLGADVGLRGLPGQLISGDNGWLGTGEIVWTAWQKGINALQIVPFFGAGGISTRLGDVTFSDTVGSGGLLARWLAGRHWTLELGWVEQFQTDNNLGVWNDWLLGDGVYGKAQYRF
jgi:hemolysin activation/secretion protein